jgi:hypothetical protein
MTRRMEKKGVIMFKANEEVTKSTIDAFCDNLKQSHEIYYEKCPEFVGNHTITRALSNASLVFGSACGTAPKQVIVLACIAGGVAGLLAPSKKIERLKDKQIKMLTESNQELTKMVYGLNEEEE